MHSILKDYRGKSLSILQGVYRTVESLFKHPVICSGDAVGLPRRLPRLCGGGPRAGRGQGAAVPEAE